MAQPSAGLIKTVRVIDKFTDTTGTWVAWLNVPLVLAVAYEVIARYAFNAPTIWSFDVTYMLYGTIFMLGAAYALHKGAHIRTDFFFEKWSIRTKGIIDSTAYLVFFFPSIFTVPLVSGDEGWYAFEIGETSEQTPWRPILWPFKMVVPLACLLLLIQGVSETIKSVYAARTGIELEHKRKGRGIDQSGLAFLGLVMLVVMIGAIFIGFPISFTLLFLALTFGYFGLGEVVFDLAYFQTIGLMKEELLAAVPLFIFMGFLTEQAGLMERLFSAFRILLAPIRGSLFAVVILTATVFAMATGIVGAAVTVLGIMARPIMIKTGYDAQARPRAHHRRRHARHPDPALGDADRDGAGARRLGGRALRGGVRPRVPARRHLPRLPARPQLHQSEARPAGAEGGARPQLAGDDQGGGGRRGAAGRLIAATLGSILAGLATPTEASRHRRARRADPRRSPTAGSPGPAFKRAVLSTTATSSMVLLLAVTSNIFGAVFARLGTANWITERCSRCRSRRS